MGPSGIDFNDFFEDRIDEGFDSYAIKHLPNILRNLWIELSFFLYS